MTLCRYADARTVIPGLKTETGTAFGQPVYSEQRELWLVVDAIRERPLTRAGWPKRAESHLSVFDYCQSRAEANALARRLHDERCPLDGCGWNNAPEAETKRETPTQVFRRFYSQVRP